jgi:hypothetical protein
MKTMKAKGLALIIATAATVLILCPLWVQAASRDDLMRIAPDGAVSGWSVMPDSTTYVQGDGLTEIYNGGYEVYTKAGVVTALRRLYMQGDAYLEVTVHGMKSPRSARDFLADRYRMETGKSAPAEAGWNRFTAARTGGTTAYAAEGPFFITIVSYSDGDKGKMQTEKFLLALDEKAKKLLKERK